MSQEALKKTDTQPDMITFENVDEKVTGTNRFVVTTLIAEISSGTTETHKTMEKDDIDERPCCSSQAVVPLSSSLPSKLLRFHAKRSTQALLQQAGNSQSVDSQFGSGSECGGNDSVETAPVPLPMFPANNDLTDDKLIDVGMGSSIGDSEESEEDDELKPLAVDNHMLNDVESAPAMSPPQQPEQQSTATLSEANLRKHHHHLYMDNIYLHPNFKCELNEQQLNNLASLPASVELSLAKTEPKYMPRTMERVISAAELSGTAKCASTEEESLIDEVATLDPAFIPSDELAKEIADAVEYYFSNENILKDAFLLKHVRRNKEGFVSLKLVSSFKRVRQLTKDWKVVGNAVRRKSKRTELNELGTKVRRIEPLPNFDETMPSRTIIVSDLPLDKLTIEKVSDIFSKCGEIALIRLLKPGMTIPVDVRQFMNKYPEMQQKECALIEFLESTSARSAKNLVGPFQVYDMVAPKKKTGKKAIIQVTSPVTRMVENLRYYNDASYERTRGGSFSGVANQDMNLRYRLKRNNSDFHARQINAEWHTQPQYYQPMQPPQLYNPPNYNNYNPNNNGQYSAQHAGIVPLDAGSPVFHSNTPRRYSNASTVLASKVSPSCENANYMPSLKPNNNKMTTNPYQSEQPPMSSVQRRLSNCSDTNTNTSAIDELSRRSSNCSEHLPQRRDSSCSENCPYTRRSSEFRTTERHRKGSLCSNGSCEERHYANNSTQFERTYSNASECSGLHRRISNDFNLDNRKHSIETQTSFTYEPENYIGSGGVSGGVAMQRRYSNNFNPSSKISAYEHAQYINGRRISTDSGYDRRYSFGSEYEGSPRSRSGSFLNNYKNTGGYENDMQPRSRTGSFLDGTPRSRSGSFAQRAAENLVRTPIGPDGSKGFGTRTRKYGQGQAISPV